MKTRRTGYWVTTIFLVFGLLSGGIAELFQRPENVEGIVHLGYPVYFVTLIGLWKVLGSIALVVPRFPRVKEWAYAGIFFNMTGAAVSHAVCGDAPFHIVATLGFALLTVASWWLRPADRVLGSGFAAGTQA